MDKARGPRRGTGLGLPFVKTVAVRHGGQVTLVSDSGQYDRKHQYWLLKWLTLFCDGIGF